MMKPVLPNIADIRLKIERMEIYYDPENDIIPGAPKVTWADAELLEIIDDMADEICELQWQLYKVAKVLEKSDLDLEITD